MDDIQPLRNFLKEIQGKPDFIYTHVEVEVYNQWQEKLKLINPVDRQQKIQYQQLLKQIEVLKGLILEYEREINDAIQYLGEVTEMEKKHLKSAFNKIRKTQQDVQALLAQVG